MQCGSSPELKALHDSFSSSRRKPGPVAFTTMNWVPAFGWTTVDERLRSRPEFAHRQRGGAILRFVLFLVAVALIAPAFLVWRDYRRFVDAPLTIASDGITIDVARGATYRAIVQQLHDSGATGEPALYWRALGRELAIEGKLHAGEYALPAGITPRELLRRMAAGEVLQHHFTIVDGW